MTRWGWRYWNSKVEILLAPLTSGSIFRSPPSFWVLSIQIFGAPLIFSEPPFRCLKIFGAPPPQYLHPPLVILNELSLNKTISCDVDSAPGVRMHLSMLCLKGVHPLHMWGTGHVMPLWAPTQIPHICLGSCPPPFPPQAYTLIDAEFMILRTKQFLIIVLNRWIDQNVNVYLSINICKHIIIHTKVLNLKLCLNM